MTTRANVCKPDPSREPRAVCARCRRPETVCYCRHLTTIDTATRIVLLQHPRERDVPIGTARMASLCLPNSELHVGVRWGGSVALAHALSDSLRPAALLYPGEGAVDVVSNPPHGPLTLVVVDGTWAQAKKVVRENPELRRLPRVAFTPPAPSEYRIRREPKADYVSTIEALVHVLGALEGAPERFAALLLPFRAMVDAQIACERAFRGARVRHARPPREPRPRVPRCLRDREADLVCVVGEANAWPYGASEREGYPDELVHWVAERVKTGETFELVIAPRHPLAPRTPAHTALSTDMLAAGRTRAELHARWRAFIRDTDLVCTWGHYAASVFLEHGGHLPESRLDLRQVARVFSRGKVGTLAECARMLGATPQPPRTVGRAGVRIAELTAIARHFVSTAARVG